MSTKNAVAFTVADLASRMSNPTAMSLLSQRMRKRRRGQAKQKWKDLVALKMRRREMKMKIRLIKLELSGPFIVVESSYHTPLLYLTYSLKLKKL